MSLFGDRMAVWSCSRSTGPILQTIEGEEPTGIDIRYGVVAGRSTDVAALGDGESGA